MKGLRILSDFCLVAGAGVVALAALNSLGFDLTMDRSVTYVVRGADPLLIMR